jgi:hypothetical protein
MGVEGLEEEEELEPAKAAATDNEERKEEGRGGEERREVMELDLTGCFEGEKAEERGAKEAAVTAKAGLESEDARNGRELSVELGLSGGGSRLATAVNGAMGEYLLPLRALCTPRESDKTCGTEQRRAYPTREPARKDCATEFASSHTQQDGMPSREEWTYRRVGVRHHQLIGRFGDLQNVARNENPCHFQLNNMY